MPPPVFILDNGASTIKCGFAHLHPQPRLIPNKVARLTKGYRQLFVADELESCTAWEDLHWRVPFERGILTNWDIEKVVWDRVFSPAVMNVDPRESSLLVTEPPLNLPNVGATYDQMVFEEYEFASYYRCTAADLIPHGKLFGPKMPEAAIVVEAGHSFTHITPILRGRPVLSGIRRIDIGGHLLTNHLKTILSFRQFEMMDLGWVVEDIKHKLCYVSQDFRGDIERAHLTPPKGADGKIPPNPLQRSYVLPDLATSRLGTALPPGLTRSPSTPDHPTVHLTNERFALPELLFHPSNLGLPQAGVAECIEQAVRSLPEEARGLAWANLGVVGGGAGFEGFGERLEREVRERAPSHMRVGVHVAEDPVTCAYTSALPFAKSRAFQQFAVTKLEYEEMGSSGIRRLWAEGGRKAPAPPAPARGKRKAEVVEEPEADEEEDGKMPVDEGAEVEEEEEEEEDEEGKKPTKGSRRRTARRSSAAATNRRASTGHRQVSGGRCKSASGQASSAGTPAPAATAAAVVASPATTGSVVGGAGGVRAGRATRSRTKAG